MARSSTFFSRSRVLHAALAAAAFALLSGCMASHTVRAERPMPTLDPHAASILEENALSASGIKLSASDGFGRILEARHVAYVRARAPQDVMLTEVSTD